MQKTESKTGEIVMYSAEVIAGLALIGLGFAALAEPFGYMITAPLLIIGGKVVQSGIEHFRSLQCST